MIPTVLESAPSQSANKSFDFGLRPSQPSHASQQFNEHSAPLGNRTNDATSHSAGYFSSGSSASGF
jgi:hypothetical protein